MEKGLTCNVVQDLLPNYIEKLTSVETNMEIEQHLSSCTLCSEVHEQMNADVEQTVKVPTIELRFLQKVKKTRLLAAALSVVLTILLSYLIYASEFKYINDKANLSLAITEYTSHKIDAYVLETKEVNGTLVVSFKDQRDTGLYGIAVLVKGVNQKYRMIHAKIKPTDYSAVVQVFPMEIKKHQYYVISGHNLSHEIKFYGLDYYGYLNPGHLSKDRVRESVKLPVKNQQFLEIYLAEEIDGMLDVSIKDSLFDLRLSHSTSLYDVYGNDITQKFVIESSDGDQGSRGISTAERFLIYVYIAIVIGIGLVFTRYFLTTT